jgi:hypothetical protein
VLAVLERFTGSALPRVEDDDAPAGPVNGDQRAPSGMR